MDSASKNIKAACDKKVPKKFPSLCALFLLTCTVSSVVLADDMRNHSPTQNMMGTLGLNTIPSARMMNEGDTHITVSRMAPYSTATFGLQVSERFYLGLRQTAESKTFGSETLHLYPGLDAKWMLYPESRFIPQISVGLQSAFGHKRMAAEYLTLSKRYQNFDFTFGFGWGRYATRDKLPNPLLLNRIHSGGSRDIDGESPNTPSDWFKGDMGLFGGVEYITPVDGLSVKTDWNSDGWVAEKKSNTTNDTPAPWSIGLSYKPASWIDAGLAYAGNNSIMARLTFTGNASQWPWHDAQQKASVKMLPYRPSTPSDDTDDDVMEDDAEFSTIENHYQTENRLGINHIFTGEKVIEATITLKENLSTPFQIGEAARYLSNIAGKTPEQIKLHIRGYGLKGYDITLNREDLERTFLTHRGSREEIWHTASISETESDEPLSYLIGEIQTAREEGKFKVNLINDVSLSEEDSGLLYRSALGLSYRSDFWRHFQSFTSARLNLADNLDKLNEYRGLSIFPVRGDIDLFTQNRLMLDRAYFLGLATPANDIHFATAFGYLEEMYMGLSGELLYRPMNRNWAIGVDAALALKRDPHSFSALGLNGDHVFSGFLNGYYEVPNSGTTLKASIGRFLAGDMGGTFGVSNEFENGVKLSANISASNKSDRDVFGGKTNIYTGVQVSLPLGEVRFIPDGSRIITNAAPLGRDTAQRLDNPTALYDRTENLSYRHVTRKWSGLTP